MAVSIGIACHLHVYSYVLLACMRMLSECTYVCDHCVHVCVYVHACMRVSTLYAECAQICFKQGHYGSSRLYLIFKPNDLYLAILLKLSQYSFKSTVVICHFHSYSYI